MLNGNLSSSKYYSIIYLPNNGELNGDIRTAWIKCFLLKKHYGEDPQKIIKQKIEVYGLHRENVIKQRYIQNPVKNLRWSFLESN